MGTPIRRRTRDSSWQWLMIGMALGIGCSLVVCLAGYVVNFIEFGDLVQDSGEASGDATVIIVTPVAVTATNAPITPTATAEATEDATQESAIADVPTMTPTTLPGSGIITITPTGLPGGGQGGTASLGAGTTTSPEIGTAFPVDPVATVTPSIGSGSPVPEALAALLTQTAKVEGGTFTMGTTLEEGLKAVEDCVIRDGGNCTQADIQDATPTHQVTINEFYMEIYEVTTTQYVAFLNQLLVQNPGSRPDRIGCGGQPCALTQEDDPQSYIQFDGTQFVVSNATFYGNHPVTYVTWWGANEYCRSIGRRLPTEAEWERAARGPANSVFPWGPEWLPENANTSRPVADGTSAVDSFPSGVSGYGMFNMSGNVGEWVWDFYLPNYYSQPDAVGPNPRGPVTSDQKVIRGGGWDNVPTYTRAVHRLSAQPGSPRGSVGFRCASDNP